MELHLNGVSWLTVDPDGYEVSLHGVEEGGAIVAAGDEAAGGLTPLSPTDGRRAVAALLDLLDGERVDSPKKDVYLAILFPGRHWCLEVRIDQEVRRLVVARHGDLLTMASGLVGFQGKLAGGVALPLSEGRRVADALLAIVEGRDPWEVAG